MDYKHVVVAREIETGATRVFPTLAAMCRAFGWEYNELRENNRPAREFPKKHDGWHLERMHVVMTTAALIDGKLHQVEK